jgi:tRNA dimethylallyltransferase
MSKKRLIIIAGPTGVGKTSAAIELAKLLKTEIINADSRQVYKEMIIGTAVPTAKELGEVKHHFVSHRSIHEKYNASQFEQDVIAFLDNWFTDHDWIIMAGGSGMYIDAVCYGIDDLPDIDPLIRKKIHQNFAEIGLEGIRLKLKEVDPLYYQKVDLNNPQRIMKALEVSEMTGRSYSSFLTGQPKARKFEIVKIGLDLPRNELHDRINTRVDQMILSGLLQEAESLYPFRRLNALNTVGYKELFAYLENQSTLVEAIEKIKGHSRQYARRQLTWFRRDPTLHWFQPSSLPEIFAYLQTPRRGL